MKMKRLVLIALSALSLASPAATLEYPTEHYGALTLDAPLAVTNGGLGNSTGNLSALSVTALGLSQAATLAARASHNLNVIDDYGAKGTAVQQRVYVQTTAGGYDLNIVTGTPNYFPTAIFSPSDVGNPIVVEAGGTPLTVGGIASIAIATPGAGYTSVPTLGVSGGSGANALLQPVMIANSATLATGGAGCTNGSQTFALVGASGTAATFTGTVSSGAVSGSVAVTGSGAATYIPWPNGMRLSGAGCATAPTVNVNFGLGSITVVGSGLNYPLTGGTTASISGGTPTTAATLGTVVVNPIIPPLAATVASYVSPSHVVLSAPFGNSLTNAQTRFVTKGPDDTAAIQAAITAAGVSGARVQLPSGGYCVTSQIEFPNGAVKLVGAGRGLFGTPNTALYACAPLNAVLHNAAIGVWWQDLPQGVSDLTIDGDSIASYDIMAAAPGTIFDHLYLLNATAANFYSAPGGGGVKMNDVWGINWNSLGLADGTTVLPPNIFYIMGTDGNYNNVQGLNATQAYVYDPSDGNNFYYAPHMWGYAPAYFYSWPNGGATVTAPEADGAVATASFYVGGAWVGINGGYIQGNSLAYGIQIAGGATLCSINGVINNSSPQYNRVNFLGTPDSTCLVENTPGGGYKTGGSLENGLYAHAFGAGALSYGDYSFTQGQYTSAQGKGSVLFGYEMVDHGRTYDFSFPTTTFSGPGDNQAIVEQFRCGTVNSSTPCRLTSDFNSVSGLNTGALPLKGGHAVFGRCETADASGNWGVYSFQGGLKSAATAGALAWIGGSAPSITTVAQDSGASTYVLSLALDNANNSLSIQGTGGPARYRCSVWTEEMVHP
jgi:hypothetical protein